MKAWIDKLPAVRKRSLEGCAQGLTLAAAILEDDMQNDPAHGNVTGATHANYAAKVFGLGRNPSSDTASQAAVVEALNPGHSAIVTFTTAAVLGVILDSVTDYQWKLETENAGQKAVLGPTLTRAAQDLTRAAAEGSRRALS